MRVEIPGKPDELVKLSKAILAKHTALGAASPLNGIEGIENFEPQTTTADTQNELAKTLNRQAETATQLRDNALGQTGQLREGTVRYFATSARDILLGMNKGKEQKLGDWGFTVNASTQSSSTPTTPAA